VTFDGLGEHAFEDDRQQDRSHPFDDARFKGASVLVAGRNFGCGSSREHAPQALMRWGIKAIIGESFAEIFFGNCTTLGVPCVCASRGDLEKLTAAVNADPKTTRKVQRFSDEYFALARKHGRAFAQYLALEGTVRLRIGNDVVEVVD